MEGWRLGINGFKVERMVVLSKFRNADRGAMAGKRIKVGTEFAQ